MMTVVGGCVDNVGRVDVMTEVASCVEDVV